MRSWVRAGLAAARQIAETIRVAGMRALQDPLAVTPLSKNGRHLAEAGAEDQDPLALVRKLHMPGLTAVQEGDSLENRECGATGELGCSHDRVDAQDFPVAGAARLQANVGDLVRPLADSALRKRAWVCFRGKRDRDDAGALAKLVEVVLVFRGLDLQSCVSSYKCLCCQVAFSPLESCGKPQ